MSKFLLYTHILIFQKINFVTEVMQVFSETVTYAVTPALNTIILQCTPNVNTHMHAFLCLFTCINTNYVSFM